MLNSAVRPPGSPYGCTDHGVLGSNPEDVTELGPYYPVAETAQLMYIGWQSFIEHKTIRAIKIAMAQAA